MYSRIFILIEGNDDERFFNRIIKPKLEKNYMLVTFYKYSEIPKKKKKINNLLSSIKSMRANYIFVTDLNATPCITAKKEAKLIKCGNIDKNKIIVVIKEIESWYLAGLDVEDSKKLGIPFYSDTSNLDKEQFNRLIPKKFDSITNFKLEILNYFQTRIAKQKNKSFEYFLNKIC